MTTYTKYMENLLNNKRSVVFNQNSEQNKIQKYVGGDNVVYRNYYVSNSNSSYFGNISENNNTLTLSSQNISLNSSNTIINGIQVNPQDLIQLTIGNIPNITTQQNGDKYYLATNKVNMYDTINTLGVNNIIYNINRYDNDNSFFVSGEFTSIGGVSANKFALWNGTNWSAFGNPNQAISAVAVDSNNNVYVGGAFINIGDININYIARWNYSQSTWQNLSGANSPSDFVYAIAIDNNNNVYVGSRNGNVYKYTISSETWAIIAGTVNGASTGNIYSLRFDNSYSNLYVGGIWNNNIGGVSSPNIGRYQISNNSIHAMPGINGAIFTIKVDSNNDVYAAGSFSNGNIARWNGTTWNYLGVGTNGRTDTIEIIGDDIIVAGQFTNAGNIANTQYIAKWKKSLSLWLNYSNPTLNNIVSGSLYMNSKLYIVGNFSFNANTDSGVKNINRLAIVNHSNNNLMVFSNNVVKEDNLISSICFNKITDYARIYFSGTTGYMLDTSEELNVNISGINLDYNTLWNKNLIVSGNATLNRNVFIQQDLNVSGNAFKSTSTWTVPSDERVKNNIEVANYETCYNNVKQLDLKHWTWNSEKYPDIVDRNVIGFIAQDVELIYPKAIITKSINFPDGSNIEDFKTLDTDQLYKNLWGALKYMQNILEQQQLKIEKLELEIENLKN